jgi:hypothetical protein
MYVERLVDAFEGAVQRLEARVVLPAVDVLGVEVKDGLVKLVGHVAGVAGLAHAGRSVKEGDFTLFSSGHGVEGGGEAVDF